MIEPSDILNSISEPVDRAFLHRLDGLDRLIESIDKLTVAMTPVQKPPESVDIRAFPGFLPLHIEDGQVQEDIPKWMREARAQTFGSVPEAEPQEQEILRDLLESLVDDARELGELQVDASREDWKLGEAIDKLSTRIDRKKEAIFAAAHREYTQPETGNG